MIEVIGVVGLGFVGLGALTLVARRFNKAAAEPVDASTRAHLESHEALLKQIYPPIELAKIKKIPTKKKSVSKKKRTCARHEKGNSLQDRAFDVLAQDPGRAFTASEIASKAGGRLPSVLALLSKLTKAGYAKRTAPSTYQFASKVKQ